MLWLFILANCAQSPTFFPFPFDIQWKRKELIVGFFFSSQYRRSPLKHVGMKVKHLRLSLFQANFTICLPYSFCLFMFLFKILKESLRNDNWVSVGWANPKIPIQH